MLIGLILLVLTACVYLPSLWVRWVMHKYSDPIEAIPGTGGELAEHLLLQFDMQDYKVEQTAPAADHYDPLAKTVRLSPDNYAGKSLTAVAVAAHEVGHALQHHRKEEIFQLRERYVPTAKRLGRLGIMILYALPLVGIIVKAPGAVFALIALSLVLQLAGALSYLIVLPEEMDASFNKALPILIKGKYVPKNHEEAIRAVLKAAALTYFAAALANVLNIGRWLMVLIRR